MYSASPRAAAQPAAPLQVSLTELSKQLSTLVLTTDEAEFIDAAMARFFPGSINAPDGSRYVDQKLHRSLHPIDDEAFSEVQGVTADLYRVTIDKVQAYCLQVYDERFQCLCAREQDVVLMLLEEGCNQMQILFEMLLNDSTEAFLTRTLWPFRE